MGKASVVFDDEHIAVGFVDFDTSGKLTLTIVEKHESVGLYQIVVSFASGNEIQLQYDGANSARHHLLVTQTVYAGDSVKQIKVTLAR
jgi:hypothetical protein